MGLPSSRGLVSTFCFLSKPLQKGELQNCFENGRCPAAANKIIVSMRDRPALAFVDASLEAFRQKSCGGDSQGISMGRLLKGGVSNCCPKQSINNAQMSALLATKKPQNFSPWWLVRHTGTQSHQYFGESRGKAACSCTLPIPILSSNQAPKSHAPRSPAEGLEGHAKQ